MSAARRKPPFSASSLSEDPANPGAARASTSRWQWLRPIVLFLGNFAGLMLIFYIVSLTRYSDEVLFPDYLCANARWANQCLQWLGQGTHVVNNSIQSPAFTVTIRRGCDAIEPSWLFCSAVIAFPAVWWRKLAGMLAGILLMQLVNLARIVSLFFIGLRAPRFFSTAHLEFWPIVFILLAIALWVSWIGWSQPRPAARSAA